MERAPDAIDVKRRLEADLLLDREGLRALLARRGVPHLFGSYLLKTMAARNLNIYLETDLASERDLFHLAGELASRYAPARMEYANTRLEGSRRWPRALYWRTAFGAGEGADGGAWTVEIWALESREFRDWMGKSYELLDRLTPAARLHAIAIKECALADPEYGRLYSSLDIYRAVLDAGATDFDAFRACVEQGKADPWGRGLHPPFLPRRG